MDSTLLRGSEEHVFLVANSDSALLASLSISLSGLHEGGVLIAIHLLG